MFRISPRLWLIALASLNLSLLQYCEAVIRFSPKFAGLIGLMPRFDFFALSVYLALTGRFRFALLRRRERKSAVDSAAVIAGRSWPLVSRVRSSLTNLARSVC